MLMAVRPSRVAPDRFERAVESGEQHPEDYVYAFCQNAYHLRDWLQNSGAASQRDLDELMARTPALKLCRDVCNGSKHFVLDQRRSSTDHIGLMREYVPPPVIGGEPGERLRLLAVEGQDGSVNFFEIEAGWRGLAYWYLLYPLHRRIFAAMLRGLRRATLAGP
jgi:hypothetical protein